MSCCGEREKLGNVKNEQKWEYINLDDFSSQSCGTPLSYGFLWFLGFVSIGVYAVDLFTACNLLFFDRWSSQVKPVVPFRISRWIFAGCIILTWVLLVYRMQRAIRAIRSGIITKCYLDPLAVQLISVNVSKKNRGWRRFLVFAALTRGRKGAEYIALFTYFTFEAWLRICFAEGPRYVINAITLYSVLKAELIPNTDGHKPVQGHTPVVQFFVNIQILANHNKEQAAILFGMLYTLIIWIFSALSLFVAVLFYLLFLWHHIPSADGTLTQYCRRKIEKRLHKIVMETVNKALAKGDKTRAANELAKPGFAGTAVNDVKRQPTLPSLDGDAASTVMPAPPQQLLQGDLAPFPPRPSSRNDTGPPRALSREPTIPDVGGNSIRPTIPSRQTTHSSVNSNTSYASDAPLMGQAADMGYGGRAQPRSESRNRPVRMESYQTTSSHRPPPGRSFSAQSRETQNSQNFRMGPPRRQNTDMSSMTVSTDYPPRSQSRPNMSREPSSIPPRNLAQSPQPFGRGPTQEFEMHPPSPGSAMSNRPPPSPSPGPRAFAPYQPYNPSRPVAPVRNFTLPYNPTTPRDYFNSSSQPPRSGTAPLPPSSGYHESIIDDYTSEPPQRELPPRPATTGPRPGQGLGYNSHGGAMPPPRW